MFREIIQLIESKDYHTAEQALKPLYQKEDQEITAKAAYLLGYINTLNENKNRNEYAAKQYLRYNMNSEYDLEYAYILYSQIEDDKNIAFNYLKQGVEHFQTNPRLLGEFFKLAPNKESAIQKITRCKVTDPNMLGLIIDHLIQKSQWDRVEQYITLIQEHNNLDEQEQIYLQLIFAYSLLFKTEPDYRKAQTIFTQIIDIDTNNALAYSHYLGSIYALIKLSSPQKAIELFDRLTVNNSICDLNDRPMPLGIYIEFERVYRIIFENMISFFTKDKTRKLKAQVLYSLYLYSPSEISEIYRYKKSDAAILDRYIKSEFNPKVAAALYHIRCHLQQFCSAYDVLWRYLRQYQSTEKSYIYFSEILEGALFEDINDIADNTANYMKMYDYDRSNFMTEIFNDLVGNLYQRKQYSRIRAIAQNLSDSEILGSDRAFECAYAFAEEDDNRAENIYEGIIRRNPNDTSAINNLGVIYEQKDDYEQARKYFEKAHLINPKADLYKNNLWRVNERIDTINRDEIKEIAERLTIDALNAIGYTNELKAQIASIQDVTMRDIISRDIFECAIAVVTGQDKMATIMCGSISEALLMLRISEKGITKYNICELNPKKNSCQNYSISKMCMDELLFVAEKEGILAKNSYHLGHYIREFRNVVHPAKEIRMKECITHENVITMWSILKRLITDLFED